MTCATGSKFTFALRGCEPFKILQLTDIHLGCGLMSRKEDVLAKEAVRAVVERTKPDLIVITGDSLYPLFVFSGTRDNERSAREFAELMESFEIPWAFVFGNHDCERRAKLDKTQLAAYYSSLKYCVFDNGPTTISGIGNYTIDITNEDGILNTVLFLLDSNAYCGNSFFSGFDNIHDNQVEWYTAVSKEINTANGRTVPSMIFCHIPINEYRDAWNAYLMGDREAVYHFGELKEPRGENYLGVPKKRGKLFDAVLDVGSTKAIFCGHDHMNTFSVTYKGVRLTYGLSIDYLAYRRYKIRDSKFQRGGTLIRLHADSSFTISQILLER